jgi:hypothetical protein
MSWSIFAMALELFAGEDEEEEEEEEEEVADRDPGVVEMLGMIRGARRPQAGSPGPGDGIAQRHHLPPQAPRGRPRSPTDVDASPLARHRIARQDDARKL